MSRDKKNAGTPQQGEEPEQYLAEGKTVTSDEGDKLFRIAIEGTPAPDPRKDPHVVFNVAVENVAELTDQNSFEDFINLVFCGEGTSRFNAGEIEELRDKASRGLATVRAYELLKYATEAYLVLVCSLRLSPREGVTDGIPNRLQLQKELGQENKPFIPGVTGTSIGEVDPQLLEEKLFEYFGGNNGVIPYLKRIVNSFGLAVARDKNSVLCNAILADRLGPCPLELIWSYWHEEGMLVQAINAVSLRFQNKSTRNGRDPLAHLALDPLRPLNNLLWGYIQDEQNRLTIARRAYEYEQEYGLTIYGKAVPQMRPVERRSKFIEAFHNLLHLSTVFFKDQSNNFLKPDPFPLLNAAKEVHMILAEGANNQFGDLPWAARIEMMIQKWLLGRPEMERFLGGRAMVPYTEKWMATVDTMKTLQGWSDTSVRYFRDLAVFGERLLLTLRWGDWSDDQRRRLGAELGQLHA